MRELSIGLLHFQQTFQYKLKSLVYLLFEVVNVAVLLLFWNAASAISAQTLSSVQTYYLVFMVLGIALMSYAEIGIAERDIHEGGLSRYLLKPYSYFRYIFHEEVWWRIIGGGWAILLVAVLWFFGVQFSIPLSAWSVGVFLLSALCGFAVSFCYKLCVGFLAFWLTHSKGVMDLSQIITIICCGYLMPLSFFPEWIQQALSLTPFPAMVVTPLQILTGNLTGMMALQAVLVQLGWVVGLYCLARVLFARGVRRFTGVGQ